MRIEQIMQREPVTVAPDTEVQEVARSLVAQCLNSVLVVEGDGTVAGIVSTGDLTHRLADEHVPQRGSWLLESLYKSPLSSSSESEGETDRVEGRTAQQVMTRKLVTVAPDDDTSAAARMLLEHRIHTVPVLEAGRLVGTVSRFDLMRCLIDHPECCNPMRAT